MLRCRARAHPARLPPCAAAAHRRWPVRSRAGGCDAAPPPARRVAGPLLELVERPSGPPHPAGRPRRRRARSGPGPQPGLAPAGVAARRAVRGIRGRRPLDAPAAAAEPACRRQCRHRLRSRFSRSPRQDTGRDSPRLRGARGESRAARRPGRGDLGAHCAGRAEPPRRRRRANRAVPARCAAGLGCFATRIRRDRFCSSGRSNRGRTCRRSLRPTNSCWREPQRPRRSSWRAALSSSRRKSSAACARATALAGRVEYRGYVSDAERQALYASASMLVLPSFHEGFGTAGRRSDAGRRARHRLDGRRLAGGGRDCRHHGGSGGRGWFLCGDGTAAGGIRPNGGGAPRPAASRRGCSRGRRARPRCSRRIARPSRGRRADG